MDDDALKALLAEDGLPERDPVFTLAVMQGVARRRFAGDMLDLALAVLVGGVLLWMLAPTIEATLVGVDMALVAQVGVGLLVAVSVLVPLRLPGLSPNLSRMTET